MNTSPITPKTLSSSVIAVPPLARNQDLTVNRDENRKLVKHIESGGVSTLLYGGNAVLAHASISEYAGLLDVLAEIAAEQTLVIPSVGPNYGTMVDQARLLKECSSFFPTAMLLPTRDLCTAAGVAAGVRKFVDIAERPVVLYIKHDGFIDVETVASLMKDGLISWIKYAIVRDDPSDDDFLRSLVDAVGSTRIVSGIGEQPAIVHLRDFGLAGFTSGCVCVAPRLSMDMLRAVQSDELEAAESIRSTFRPLEDLRNNINPVRVLHSAVTSAGIADMGPLLPLLSEIDPTQKNDVQAAAQKLLGAEASTATKSD